MFKRQPSKVFMKENQLLIMKVVLQVHQNFLLISAKSAHIEIRLIIPKNFDLIENHRYKLILNDSDFDEAENESIYSYHGRNVFHDSFFKVKNYRYNFHSGIFKLNFPSFREISISFQALLEKDGIYTKAWFRLNPIITEVETALHLDFSDVKTGMSTEEYMEEREGTVTLHRSKSISEMNLLDFEEFPIWIFDLENERLENQDETWVTPWLEEGIPDDDFLTIVKVCMCGSGEHLGVANIYYSKSGLDLYSLDFHNQDKLLSIEDLFRYEGYIEINIHNKIYIFPRSKSLKTPVRLVLKNKSNI